MYSQTALVYTLLKYLSCDEDEYLFDLGNHIIVKPVKQEECISGPNTIVSNKCPPVLLSAL